MVDSAFAIRYVNTKAEEFFYASAATLQGVDLSELIPVDSPVFSLIRQVLRSAAPVVDHGLIIESRRIGQRDVLIQVTPLGDPPDCAIVAFQERSIRRTAGSAIQSTRRRPFGAGNGGDAGA